MSKTEVIHNNVNSVSRISEGTSIKGEINSPYDIRLDGNFEGKLVSAGTIEGDLQCSGKVVIGEKACVKGDVICANMDIYGNLEGNVFVKEVLALKESCKVKGNLNIRKLIVELDSEFNGNCRMLDESSISREADKAKEEAGE